MHNLVGHIIICTIVLLFRIFRHLEGNFDIDCTKKYHEFNAVI